MEVAEETTTITTTTAVLAVGEVAEETTIITTTTAVLAVVEVAEEITTIITTEERDGERGRLGSCVLFLEVENWEDLWRALALTARVQEIALAQIVLQSWPKKQRKWMDEQTGHLLPLKHHLTQT